MAYPINVAFVWHFHQPYYKDNFSNKFLMPWTRLHATKDYYFMPNLVNNFPDIHCTFNFSPSLLTQINDYIINYKSGDLDTFLKISNTNILDISIDEKIFIINNFFPSCASSNNFLKRSKHFYALYLRLYNNKNIHLMSEEDKLDLFSNQDLIDIIVLFNLLWIDPLSIETDEFLLSLKQKDSHFTEKEKEKLINDKIPAIMGKIIPILHNLIDNQQIELSGSPFYHPILPLLCDTNTANFNAQGLILPSPPFKHPEDADYQIKNSINYFNDNLNYKINGLWPSEGSVSEKAVSIIIDNKIKWIASDEEILGNSIGLNLTNANNRNILFKPYVIKRENGNVYIIFRDKILSDLIGFKYYNYNAKEAALDLINNIKNVAINIGNDNKNGLSIISIILDGENAWEYYENNALDFFNYLYDGLSKEKLINTVTVSEHIKHLEEDNNINSSSYEFKNIKWNDIANHDFKQVYNIPIIYPGSWINHDFRIWIGHEEDNKSWEILLKTRDFLENIKTKLDPEKLKKAWEQIYIAEGSDYNWWYGDDRSSGIDDQYDELYRTHLSNVYRFVDESIPDEYFIPILSSKKSVNPNLDAVSFIDPSIDGLIDNYYEWLGSAVYFPGIIGGKAMAHVNRFIKSVHYGFNASNIFFRIDFFKKNINNLIDKETIINFINPLNYKIYNEFFKNNNDAALQGLSYLINTAENKQDSINAGFKEVLELSLPLSTLNLNPLDMVQFFIILTFKNNMLVEIERIPANGYFEVRVPDKNFEILNWLV